MSPLSTSQPYPGLRPFDAQDREFFFGRDAQIDNLRQKVGAHRLVAVVGRSGCGKSSLMKAGLIPRLRTERDGAGAPLWRIATMRPQGRPIEELGNVLLELTPDITEGSRELRRLRLDAMLRRSSQGLVEAASELGIPDSGKLLVLVDQFEEIFRFEDPQGSNTDEATAFVRLLIEATGAEHPIIHVVLTMRLDFLGDCARFQRLPEAISDGQFLVPNLSRSERRAAIEKPAERSNKQIKPEVTQRLLNEIGDDPDQLPVLQHVLMRMWQEADNDSEIALPHYLATGGVAEAISRHADQVYRELPSDAHRSAAERLFKAISERDRRGRSIRRATPFAEIAAIVRDDNAAVSDADSDKIIIDVIEAFRAPECCFLMPPSGTAIAPITPIDISHESLLRGWIRLIGSQEQEGWIAEEAGNGRKYNDLLEDERRNYIFPSDIADERAQWWAQARPNAAWAKRYGNNFSGVKRFLDAVRDRHAKEREIRQKKAARTRRLRKFVGVSIGALIGIVIGSIYFQELRHARLEAERAQQQQEAIEQAKIKAERDADTKYSQAQRDIETQREQLEKIRNDISQTAKTAERSATSQQVRQELNNLVKSSTDVSDAAALRVVVNSNKAIPTTLQGNIGSIWIGTVGSNMRSNLNTPAGGPVQPNVAKAGEEYASNIDIYLRQGEPASDSSQKNSLGILPEGTRVRILDNPVHFTRTTGDQYWAKVEVVKLALSIVNFQFTGSRDQAQRISKGLQDIGYKIQGEERNDAASGKREVRYFYDGQKAVADKLVDDTNQTLKKSGYPPLSGPAVLIGSTPRNNPDGRLELWIDLRQK